jgi:hypothetical protein
MGREVEPVMQAAALITEDDPEIAELIRSEDAVVTFGPFVRNLDALVLKKDGSPRRPNRGYEGETLSWTRFFARLPAQAPALEGSFAVSFIGKAVLLRRQACMKNLAGTFALVDPDMERFLSFVIDVSKRERVEIFTTKTIECLGRVDIVINGINLLGVVFCMKAFLPHLLNQ